MKTTEDLKSRFLLLHEFVRQAQEELDENAWDYLIGGAETETSVARNRHAIERLAFRPRVLRDVSSIDAGSNLFQKPTRLPILLAPVGGLEAFDRDAALTVARAAGEFGVPMMLSSVSSVAIEDARRETGNGTIVQLYVRGDEAWVDAQVERALACGCDAFCLTVDLAVYSRRERDIEKRFVKPWRAGVDDQAVVCQAALNWDTVARLKKNYDIPLILKGIATGEDARIAVEHGVDVIYVSNHGGRQLDFGRGSLDILPEVLKVTDGRAVTLVDGGFCRGTDIVKAMAMGADGVGIGRLYCYAMAAAGAPGIVRMLEILEAEILATLGLLGAASWKGVSRDQICFDAPGTSRPDVLSAFPLLREEVR